MISHEKLYSLPEAVRIAIAGSVGASPDTRLVLAGDASWTVRKAASSYLAKMTPAELACFQSELDATGIIAQMSVDSLRRAIIELSALPISLHQASQFLVDRC